jgi:hypothetical protein
MSCGYLLDIIPFIDAGLVPETIAMIIKYNLCVMVA